MLDFPCRFKEIGKIFFSVASPCRLSIERKKKKDVDSKYRLKIFFIIFFPGLRAMSIDWLNQEKDLIWIILYWFPYWEGGGGVVTLLQQSLLASKLLELPHLSTKRNIPSPFCFFPARKRQKKIGLPFWMPSKAIEGLKVMTRVYFNIKQSK